MFYDGVFTVYRIFSHRVFYFCPYTLANGWDCIRPVLILPTDNEYDRGENKMGGGDKPGNMTEV